MYGTSCRFSDQPTDWEEARTLQAFREVLTEAIAKTLHQHCKDYDYMPSDDDAIEFLELLDEQLQEHLVPHEDWQSFRELATRDDDASVLARKAWGKALEGGERLEAAKAIGELVEALENTSGVLQAMARSAGIEDERDFTFTNDWAGKGTVTLGGVLDGANDALTKYKEGKP